MGRKEWEEEQRKGQGRVQLSAVLPCLLFEAKLTSVYCLLIHSEETLFSHARLWTPIWWLSFNLTGVPGGTSESCNGERGRGCQNCPQAWWLYPCGAHGSGTQSQPGHSPRYHGWIYPACVCIRHVMLGTSLAPSHSLHHMHFIGNSGLIRILCSDLKILLLWCLCSAYHYTKLFSPFVRCFGNL